ncbi:MAG: helix-turn-helix transcriptional regulator [Chloroflexota bacterium]
MSAAQDIQEFLTTRRARLSPERAGLPTFGRSRRVPGLRREEVALLAGISVEYYTRLERGNARGVSGDVLESVCQALQLDEAERAHLLDLVRTANDERPPRRVTPPAQVRPSVRRVIDAMTDLPASVSNGRLDVVYANQMFEALYSDVFAEPQRPVNTGRFMFLDPRARIFYLDWETLARDVVAALHGEAGRDPYDRALSDLIGLLSTRSEEFRVAWARHDVRFHRSGVKRFRHPLVGELTLAYERLDLPADPGLHMVVYSAEPGSPTEARLRELGDWAATRSRFAAAAVEA